MEREAAAGQRRARYTDQPLRQLPVRKSSCLAFTDWNQMQFVLIVHNRTPNCFRATALRRHDGRVLQCHQRAERIDQLADVFRQRTTHYLPTFKTPVSVNGVPMAAKSEWCTAIMKDILVGQSRLPAAVLYIHNLQLTISAKNKQFLLSAPCYSMGQMIKSVCVCQSVCVSSLSRSHFFVDFHQIGHIGVNPQK